MDDFSLDPEADNGGGSYDTGGNPVDAAYNDANGPPPGAVRTEEPGIYQNPDGTFWFAPVTVTETRSPEVQSPSFGGMNVLNELFGIGSAQAAETPQGPMNLGDVRRGAEAAAARGTLDDYLAQDPRRAEVINDKSWLDNLFGSYMSRLQDQNKAALAPVDTSINANAAVAPDYNTPTNPYTYGTNANVGVLGLNGPYGLAPGEIGSGVGPGNVATMGFGDNTAAQQNVTLDYTAPKTGVQFGGSQNLVGQFTVDGPEAYRSGVGNPYGDYTPIGPDETANQPAVTLDNTAPITVAKPAVAPNENSWTGPTTNWIGNSSGSDTAMSSTGYTKDAATTSKEKLWSDFPFGTGSPIGADGYGISSATPIDTTTNTAIDTTSASAGSPSFRRKYLGASSDPYHYGFGAERQYYGLAPAAASGGYFDADQYFANGGLVSPMQPPSQSTVPPFPTMAFTDGGGPVGSIAQPPGLLASESVGSDAPHASPMAPSVAASVPTMQPGLATLSMRNVNASPAPSPISQNPNVGYALGQSPLSNV
jgi:hypothetical protein